MQTRRDPGATFDTYTGCQQRACHDSALGAPSLAQTQDNSDEQLRFKVLYEEKRVCDLWEHACPQSFVNKLCMALNTRASASDRTTRVSRRVRACMLMNVSIHASHGPGAAAYLRAVLWSNSPAGTACSWLSPKSMDLQADASDGVTRVSRRVRACMSTIVSTHALHGPGAAA